MGAVVNLKRTVNDMVESIRSDFPKAQHGILVLFDEEGGMHTAWLNVNDQQLALAACRLVKLAAGE